MAAAVDSSDKPSRRSGGRRTSKTLASAPYITATSSGVDVPEPAESVEKAPPAKDTVSDL